MVRHAAGGRQLPPTHHQPPDQEAPGDDTLLNIEYYWRRGFGFTFCKILEPSVSEGFMDKCPNLMCHVLYSPILTVSNVAYKSGHGLLTGQIECQ